jgi:hypothetical protein
LLVSNLNQALAEQFAIQSLGQRLFIDRSGASNSAGSHAVKTLFETGQRRF